MNIPADRYKQGQDVASVVGDGLIKAFPFLEGCKPVTEDPQRCYFQRVWEPQLAIIGADDLPPTDKAGNVLRASTTLKISIRLPPTLDHKVAKKFVEETLTKDPPYGAKVTANSFSLGGWNAPPTQPYLEEILDRAGRNFYGKPPLYAGDGGTIPFLSFLGKCYPKAQFVVTGVLGPGSNPHGPNECLEIDFTKKLICCISQVIVDSCPHLKK